MVSQLKFFSPPKWLQCHLALSMRSRNISLTSARQRRELLPSIIHHELPQLRHKKKKNNNKRTNNNNNIK